MKKRILLIGTIPPELGSKNFGGVARTVWSLAKEFRKRNIGFRIGALGRYYKRYQMVEGIEIYGIGFSIVAFIKALFFTFKVLNLFFGLYIEKD